jgi:phospholipase/lecithinase/hemolysin
MTKQFLLRGLLVLYLSLPIGASAEHSFSNLFVFGDSLSDTGNLAALSGFGFLNNFPFDKGFSNGGRAVGVLAKSLGLNVDPSLHLVGPPVGTNFAVSGARARGASPIDLFAQIGSFLLNNGGTAPSDALYVVFIGGNDVRDARDEANKHLAKEFIRDAVKSIDLSVRSLVAAGAKAIMVVNVSDIGAIPESLQSSNEKLSERATELTKQFNKELSRRVHRTEYDHSLDLIEFDLYQFFRLAINNSIALGFTNNNEACFSFSSVTLIFHPDCNFDQFVFFDEIHPTQRIHVRVGRALFAVVPELFEVAP